MKIKSIKKILDNNPLFYQKIFNILQGKKTKASKILTFGETESKDFLLTSWTEI